MQQQFQLPKTLATIDSFTPRAEKHGKENKPAGTLKISLTAHNTILDCFGTGFRLFLFRKAAAGEQQTEGDSLTELAMPNLAALRLNEKFPGYTLQIDTGLELSEPTILEGVELSAFAFEPLKGGSVKLSFNAACHPDDEKQFGTLCQLIQNKAEITLTPPAPDMQQSLFDGSANDPDDDDDDEENAVGDTLDAQEEAERLSQLGQAA